MNPEDIPSSDPKLILDWNFKLPPKISLDEPAVEAVQPVEASPEEIEPINYEIIYDGPSELLNIAVWDPQTEKLLVYLPEHYVEYEPHHALVRSYVYADGIYRFTAESVAFRVTVDESKLPSCKSFVPTSQMIAMGSKLPTKWDYTQAPLHPACMHPSVQGNPSAHCLFTTNPSACSIYERDDWADLKRASIDNKVVMSIQQMHALPRVPFFRVVQGDVITSCETFHDAENMFAIEFAKYNDDAIISYVSPEVTPYIETVLQ